MTRHKGWNVKHSFSSTFVNALADLYTKYGEEVFSIQGIANSHMDIALFTKRFFNKSSNVAAVSVDSNANVVTKDVSQYNHENNKAVMRLQGLAFLYAKVEELYGVETANEILDSVVSGEVFVNDLHLFHTVYCYAFDLRHMLMKGLDFFNGVMKVGPPKRTNSFVHLLIQAVAYISNQTAGACSFPDAFLTLDYFLNKEFGDGYIYKMSKETKKEIENYFQNIVYALNWPFRSSQSSFTNLSVMDKGFMNSLFEGYVFPDGTKADIESTYVLQKMFFEYFERIYGDKGVFTFPVMTLAISVDENNDYIDPEFVDWCAEVNSGKSIANIFQSEPTSFSSCCFDSTQKVITKGSGHVHLKTIKDIIQMSQKNKNNLKIFHNGSWFFGKPIAVKNNRNLVRITTANNKSIVVTKDHLCPTLRGDVSANEVTESDHLLFNTLPLNGSQTYKSHLTYEQGFSVGAFLGDGSYLTTKKEGHEKRYVGVGYSLNENKYKEVKENVDVATRQLGGVEELKLGKEYNNVCPTTTKAKEIIDLVRNWVIGERSYTKKLNMDCFLESYDFRKGILDGWYATDGGNSNRCYTTSSELAEGMEALITSLGMQSIINISDITDEKIVIRGEEYKRNYPLYCVRWYTPKNKMSMKGVYKVRNNSMYFKVVSIEEVPPTEDHVYCFEMKKKDSPYFTLPNGIITHNCRLKNNLEEVGSLGIQNSFGVGGLSVGSSRVVGLNLARLAKTNTPAKDVLEKVRIIQTAHRAFIEERTQEGFLPLISSGWINLKRQYCTIGLNACNEYVSNKGLDILTDEGQDSLKALLQEVEDFASNWQKESGTLINIEQIPGESVSIRLANLDRTLGHNDTYDMYSNQYIPLTTEASIYDRLKIQGAFDSMTSGGAICHVSMFGEKPLTTERYKAIMVQAKDLGCQYFAINYAYSKCSDDHVTVGKIDKCFCGKDIVEIYSRVVGFITPVSAWSPKDRHKILNIE